MVIDITKQILQIIQLWREECNTSQPLKIDSNELISLMNYLAGEAKKTFNEITDELNREVLEYELSLIRRIIDDLLWIRLQKIILAALEGKTPENINAAEYMVFKKVKELIDRFSDVFRLSRDTKFNLSMLELKSKIREKKENYQLGVLESDIEDFVSLEGFIYRGLKAGDIISIDPQSMKFLEKSNLVKRIFKANKDETSSQQKT